MFTLLMQDSFISTGSAYDIDLPGDWSSIEVTNVTQAGTTQTPGRGFKFEAVKGDPEGSQLRYFKSDGSNAVNVDTDSSGGFTYYESFPAPGPQVSGTAITAANPAVVTMTNTFSNNDRVVLYGTTGMLQIAGMSFTISSVSGSGFTLLGLDSSAFSAPATAVKARLVSPVDPVAPMTLYVTKITQASQAVVTVSTKHDYQVNQLVHFSVPSSMGMQQMDQKTGKIVAVTDYTMTVDINSSSFSAFAFPASSLSPTSRLFATVAPAGQRNGYNVDQVPFHSGLFIPFIRLAAGAQSPAGSSGDVMVWKVWRKEN